MNAVTYIQLTQDQLDAVAERAASIAVERVARQHGDVLSLKEVAQHFRVTEKTVTNWERSGRIPARKNGYWNKADVLQVPH